MGKGTWCSKKNLGSVSDRATEVASCAETDDSIAQGRLGQGRKHGRDVGEGRLAASAVTAQWHPWRGLTRYTEDSPDIPDNPL